MEKTELLWLKEKRKSRGLTTYEAGKQIGISQSMYSSIENGSRRVSVENAKKLAKLFKFKWTKFFE